jgi:hypothetical protein
MSVYVVTWNLNQERSNYGNARQAFIQQIERYDNVKDSGLETVRWISTRSTASEVDTDLRKNLDQNDRLFVSKLNPDENHGWLSKSTWEWINARL